MIINSVISVIPFSSALYVRTTRTDQAENDLQW